MRLPTPFYAAILCATMCALCRAGELNGQLWLTTETIDENQGKKSRIEENLNLNFRDYLSSTDRIDAYFNAIHDKRSDRDYDEFRPYTSLTLSGTDYRSTAYYSQFRDKGYKGGTGLLKTDNFFTSLALTPAVLPMIQLEYAENSSKDDILPRETDMLNTTKSVNLNKLYAPFAIELRHQETSVTNKATGQSTVFFSGVSGIEADSAGNVYVVDSSSARIIKLTEGGTYITDWGSYGSAEGQSKNASKLAVDKDGFIYVADTDNDRVQKFDQGGSFVLQWGSPGTGDGEMDAPIDVAVDRSGNVYVLENANNRIQKFTNNGSFIKSWGTEGSSRSQFNRPRAIVYNSGEIFVVDTGNHRIEKFDDQGNYITLWGGFGSGNGQLSSPRDIAVGSDGMLYVTDSGNNRVQKFNTSGGFILSWGELGTQEGNFNSPDGIGAGPSGSIYVADTGNNRIQKFASTGNHLATFSNIRWDSAAQLTDTDNTSANISFRVEPFEKFTVNTAFNIYDSSTETTGRTKLESDSTSRDLSLGLNYSPVKQLSFGSNVVRSDYDSMSGDSSNDSSTLNRSFFASLVPFELVRLHFLNSATESKQATSDDVETATNSYTADLDPFDFFKLRLNLTDSRTFQGPEVTSDSESYSASWNADVYDGIDLNVTWRTGDSKSPQSATETENQTLATRLGLRPFESLNLTAEYDRTHSDTKTSTAPSVSSEVDNIRLSLGYNPHPGWNLSAFTYVFKTEQAGSVTEMQTYNTSLSWRRGITDAFFTYSASDGGGGDYFSGQFNFNINSGRDQLVLRYEEFLGETASAGRTVMSMQFRKSF